MATPASPLGLGSWAIGAGRNGTSNLGPQEDADSIAAIHRAVERGITWIDTAPYYGFGHAEEMIGRALAGMGERPLVFTKCGMVPAPPGHHEHFEHRLDRASLRAEVEASLRRLGTDVIDLMQIHWPIPDEGLEEGWATLAELKRAGTVRYIGVSNFSPEQMARCEAISPVDSTQPPYSLVDREAEAEVFPYCERVGIGAIVYSPLKNGLLSGTMTRDRIATFGPTDWRHENPDYVEPLLSRNLRLVDVLRTIAERHGCSPAEVAIAWTLRRPAVAGAIVGGRNPEQVDRSAGAADVQLDEDDLAPIEACLARDASTTAAS
jgi:aryl-alcohol dehydrogenase-like predicted oxidoreductase